MTSGYENTVVWTLLHVLSHLIPSAADELGTITPHPVDQEAETGAQAHHLPVAELEFRPSSIPRELNLLSCSHYLFLQDMFSSRRTAVPGEMWWPGATRPLDTLERARVPELGTRRHVRGSPPNTVCPKTRDWAETRHSVHSVYC